MTASRFGRVRVGEPYMAATMSANSQGRPWQPRPTTTPSQPVASIMRTASSPSQMSPLPSTGRSVASLSRAISSQRAWPE